MLLPLVASAQTKRTIHVATAGTLPTLITEEEKYQIEELTLTGELNGTDLRLIRNMGGIDTDDRVGSTYVEYINTDGKLKTLDISGATIVSGGSGYMKYYAGTDDTDYLYTKDNCIPFQLFHKTKLESIKIPNSVTSIGSEAFKDLTGLTSITIPNNVTSIGFSVFQGCSGLTSVTLPNSITSISSSLFHGCTQLSSITIPNSVTSIESGAFAACSGLTSITIPNSVTNIGYDAFSSCTGLTSITIPNSVTTIGESAFWACSLTSVTIGNGIKKINQHAFHGCKNLTDLYCMAEFLYSTEHWDGLKTDTYAFEGSNYQNATLHVPATDINSYMTTAPWSGFGKIVAMSDIQKCATPTISFEGGKIKFSCETDGVEFYSELSTDDTGDRNTNEINISGKITVKVYATKAGCINSDIATAEIVVPGSLKGDLNEDGTVNVADHVELSKIILGQ